jgi:chemosensory pili system protein ChpA (sensor histidine kinase/response regulator)
MFTGLDGKKVEILGKKRQLLQLGEFIGNEPAPPMSLIGKTALLYESSEKNCVLMVDEVFGSEEVVIKPLLKPLDQIGGLLGAAVVGDGELVPILDLPALFRTKIGRNLTPEAPVAAQPKRAFDVLVVDDSPSVRHLTSKVIQSAGWTVKTAKDGLDALEVLKAAEALPSIILTDIEMPRMDGYELAASLQRSEQFNAIPVIMITSRTADKHREKALENGVSQYLTKPFEDRELVGSIRSLCPDLT